MTFLKGKEALIGREGINVKLPYRFDPSIQRDIRGKQARKAVDWINA